MVTVITALPAAVLVIFSLYHYLIHRLEKFFEESKKNGPVCPKRHSDMVRVAKEFREAEMTEEQWDTKYGAFRKFLYAVSGFPIPWLEYAIRVLQPVEVYLFHGGYTFLKWKQKIDRPIFIIGDYRSGTSVLERIITHHPDVCHFSLTHSGLWSAPGIWDFITKFMLSIRKTLGDELWNRPGGPGMYYPHSSDNLLTRSDPFEAESIWDESVFSLRKDRHYEWQSLDSAKNPDNCSNRDVATEHSDDPRFEGMFKTAIRLLLRNGGKKRFINKNPLYAFRIGWLKKLFPDAKFIHIRRNPVKTCKSQILMHRSNLKAFFIDEMEFRKAGMYPKPPKDYMKSKDNWAYIMHGQNPNDFVKQLWMPHVWPRTFPEHAEIQRKLKEGKNECAFAVGIVQSERVAHESYSRLGFEEGSDVMHVWLEDLLEDASLICRRLFDFLELETSDEMLLQFLEKEDFPNGKANPMRGKRCAARNTAQFGRHTDEVLRILKPLAAPFKARKSVYERFED